MQAPEPSSGTRKQNTLRQAVKRKTPLERGAFLDGACGGDATLPVGMEAWAAKHEEGRQGSEQNAEAVNCPLEESTTEVTPTLLDVPGARNKAVLVWAVIRTLGPHV